MNAKSLHRMVVLAMGIAVVTANGPAAGGACAFGCPQNVAWEFAAVAESVRPPAADAQSGELKKQESARPVLQPVPAESRTVEEATKRAADPKDPSGALIVAPPGLETSKPKR